MSVEYDIKDPGLAEGGRRKIQWAENEMPVLSQIQARFAKEQPLKGTKIAACLHVTTETAVLMKTLRAGGAEVALCASNPLSTQDDVASALVDDGIPVYAVRAEDSETFYRHINAILDTEPHIVFDDGADTTTVLHRERTTQPKIGRASCRERV